MGHRIIKELPRNATRKGEERGWNSITFEEPLVLSPIEGELGEEMGMDPKTRGLVSFGEGCCKEEGTPVSGATESLKEQAPRDHQHPLSQGWAPSLGSCSVGAGLSPASGPLATTPVCGLIATSK